MKLRVELDTEELVTRMREDGFVTREMLDDEMPNLDDYVTRDDLPDLDDYVEKSDLESLVADEGFVQQDDLPDLDDYVTTSQLQDVVNEAVSDEISNRGLTDSSDIEDAMASWVIEQARSMPKDSGGRCRLGDAVEEMAHTLIFGDVINGTVDDALLKGFVARLKTLWKDPEVLALVDEFRADRSDTMAEIQAQGEPVVDPPAERPVPNETQQQIHERLRNERMMLDGDHGPAAIRFAGDNVMYVYPNQQLAATRWWQDPRPGAHDGPGGLIPVVMVEWPEPEESQTGTTCWFLELTSENAPAVGGGSRLMVGPFDTQGDLQAWADRNGRPGTMRQGERP